MFKHFTIAVVACAAGFALAGTGAAQAQGKSFFLRAEGALCVDVAGGKFERFNKIILWHCHGKAPQVFTYDRQSGQIRVAARPELCVEVDRSPEPPERLHLVRCNGQDQSMHPWTYDAVTGVVRSRDGICWDVPRGNYQPGQDLIGSRCIARAVNQQFVMNDPPPAAVQPAPPRNRPRTQYPVESDAHRMGSGCPRLGQFRSPASNARATIEFIGRADRAVTVYWIDFNGNPVDYGGLDGRKTLRFNTFVGHYWIAKDFDGRCYGGVVSVRPGANRIVIRP